MRYLREALASLPKGDVPRWTARIKASVVIALDSGVLSQDEALSRWPDLTIEEIASWRSLMDAHGARALRATRVREFSPASSIATASGRSAGATGVVVDGGPDPAWSLRDRR
jgi:hypothetical protein